MDSWSCCGGNALLPHEASLWILGVALCWQCIVTNEASLWILGVASCGGNALLPHEASLWILGVASCGGNALLPHEASLWILGVALWWQCIATTCGKSMDSWSCCGGNACYNEARLWILGVVVVAMHCYHMRQVYGFLELPCGGNALLPHEARLHGFLELPHVVAMHCYHMRQVYGFLELPHVVAMHCYHMRQVYGFLELPGCSNALLPHEASLWILGVASCGGNALLPMRQVYGFLELPHVVAMHCYHMRQVYGFHHNNWSCCGGNACYNGASLWILGVASCGGNALLPMRQVQWILGVALWWQCIATT